MGKQSTLTSFFRPLNSSPEKRNKRPSTSPPTASGPSPKKRPRPSTAPTVNTSQKHSAKSKSPHPKQSKPPRDKSPPAKLQTPQSSQSQPTTQPDASDIDDDNSQSHSHQQTASLTTTKPSKRNTASSHTYAKPTWNAGAPVPYTFLADAFTKVEQITGRLQIQAILSDLFRAIIVATPEDLVNTIYLCINKLAPAHEGIELGVGESILLKSLSMVTGRTVAALKAKYKQIGDLGDVAYVSRTTQKTMFPPPPLTVRKVYKEFRTIASVSGKNTQDEKQSKILKMLVAASKTEAKYITRALLGKLRIHLADKTVIASLAAAFVLENEHASTDILLEQDGSKKPKLSAREERIEQLIKDATASLNSVYSQLPVWDIIIPKLLQFGTIDERLSEACKLVPGVPVSPMLAKPTKAISQVLDRFAEVTFTCEYKYDGERAQIHRLPDGTIKIYSRNAENLTPKYPDLVKQLPLALRKQFKSSSFIIDSEAVAYDTERKKILPFQELQSRKRKDVNADDIKVKVCIFVFDLLYFDGTSLIEEPLSKRRFLLSEGFGEQEGQFMFAKSHDSRDPEQIMELLNASVKEGCEGLMVKALDGSNATYEPANRSQNWLKVKKDYLEGCGDSLDLVPIGGYRGRGKRTGSYGAFLLACYDPDNEEYQSVCKIGTGFSEAQLEQFAKFFDDPEHRRTSKKAKSYYRTPTLNTLEPDVWFEPVQVWEVKCADLSISPQHTAGIGQVDPNKGVALRFPRFLRVRDDKNPEDATTAEQVVEMYLDQSAVSNDV